MLSFFLDVISDITEYDLARVEILKLLPAHDYTHSDRLKITQTLIQIFFNKSDDHLVRQWAAIAIQHYMDTTSAIEAIRKIVLDSEEGVVLRHNAFWALRNLGPTNQSVEVMRLLVSDEEFRSPATRILKEWGIT
ncbi:MAG TPA: hypothetical protein VKY74_11055 [Chloroflexia bacterium]|nr:hypothetical protein [Chloroflexia bacterium]